MSVVRGCVCSLLARQAALPQTIRALGSSVAASNQPQQSDALYKRIHLEMSAHDRAVLQSYTTVLKAAATHLGITHGDFEMSRKPNKHRLTLLKSVHIYKKHRVQYEVRTHTASLALHRLTGSTADTYLEYVQRCLPEGVGMKVTKVAIEKLPEHLKAR